MNLLGIRVQPRSLLPQFENIIDQPSIRDDNTEDDPRDHRLLDEVMPEISQGFYLCNNLLFIY